MNNITGDVKDLLIKLNFLSEVKVGYKINVCNRSFIKPQNYIGRAMRSWYREDRKTTLNYIEDITNRLSEVITYHTEEEIIEKIKNILPKAINGLETLSNTYNNDPDIHSALVVQISIMDMLMKKL